jgi:hypothetical protein
MTGSVQALVEQCLLNGNQKVIGEHAKKDVGLDSLFLAPKLSRRARKSG